MDAGSPEYGKGARLVALGIRPPDHFTARPHDGIARAEPGPSLASPRDRLRTSHSVASRGRAIRAVQASGAPSAQRSDPSRAANWDLLNDFPVPTEVRLQELFGLTRAEVRLAQGLARGESLEEVAESLEIRMTTARTQLASIFAKTDTRRQAKLVAILSRIAHLG